MADEKKSDEAKSVDAVIVQTDEATQQPADANAVETKPETPTVKNVRRPKKNSISEPKTDEQKTIKDLADLGAAAQAKADEEKISAEAATIEVSEVSGSKTLTDLADLTPDIATLVESRIYVQRLDQLGRAYATGKRKDAVARVWIKPGVGRIVVNDRDIEVFFARPVLRMVINQPFIAVDRGGQFDVMCTVKGGGLSGQAGAVRHGISKALLAYEPTLRPALKSGGFLTRDSRVVERKKYGKAKARRSFQFSKR